MHRGDSYRSEPRVKNIFAMSWRIHPAGVNNLRTRADGNVFGDNAEARASFRKASFKIGFAGKLVLEHIQIRHAETVLARGFEEGVVPLKRGEALRGAFAIESFEELALGVVALELRVHAGGNKK